MSQATDASIDHFNREQDDYNDYSDLKAARRFAERLTPEKIKALQDDELVIVPARILKQRAA